MSLHALIASRFLNVVKGLYELAPACPSFSAYIYTTLPTNHCLDPGTFLLSAYQALLNWGLSPCHTDSWEYSSPALHATRLFYPSGLTIVLPSERPLLIPHPTEVPAPQLFPALVNIVFVCFVLNSLQFFISLFFFSQSVLLSAAWGEQRYMPIFFTFEYLAAGTVSGINSSPILVEWKLLLR